MLITKYFVFLFNLKNENYKLQAEAQVVLQPAKRTPPKPATPKLQAHNELRTRRPMW